MAFEPNKENFMARLAAKDFNAADLLEDVDALQEVLWYLDGRRTREIVDTLFDVKATSRLQAAQVIKNLAKLYPLSKPLVMSIMAEVREPAYEGNKKIYRDATFLEGFDAAEETRRAILETFRQIGEHIIRLTKDVTNYQRSLEQLKNEREKLNESSDKLNALRRERDELQAQVDKLRNDADEKILREQNESLRVEFDKLQAEKRRRQVERQNWTRQIDELKAELQDLADHTEETEETRMIRDLLKKFPSDAEDFEQ